MSTESRTPPPFLAHLGLDEAADDRAIRRAYARLLKQIDQEKDPGGFQSLRQAYEVSLQWFAHRQQAEDGEQAGAEPPAPAEAPAPTEPPAPAEPVLPAEPPLPAAREPGHGPGDAAALRQAAARAAEASAREVFEAMRAMLPQRRRGAHEKVQAWLQQALDGERLIDMDARFLFEGGVVSLLANGWQPGHEYLFGPAMECFGWRRDRGRLAAFGRAGAVIASAIDELDFYDGQPKNVRVGQRDLIRRLRDDRRPGTGFLLRHLPRVLHLRSLFPHWLHVITAMGNVERWSEWAAAVPRWRRWLTYAPARAPVPAPADAARPFSVPESSFRIGNGWIIFGVVILTALLRTCLQNDPPRSAPSPAAPVHGSLPPGTGVGGIYPGLSPREPAGPVPPSLSARATPVTPLQPVYPPEARRRGHEGRVVVSATIGSMGQARDVSIAQSSGHRELDESALAAVRNATFHPAKDSQGYAVDASYRIPFNFVLSDKPGAGPADKPLTGLAVKPRDYAQRIRDAFQSQIILPQGVTGNPAAEVRLRLSAQGAIESYRLVQPSGSADWDQAVLRAVARVQRVPADDRGQFPPEMVITFRPRP
ncbi:TonB family protein [Paracidovorax avenae]|uniref:TonB family protein n=1 Tax=Paracidovorax avenae TaxID=80867 RepID=UPI0006B374D3|nr:TonB family protein [Paracidovorax avenae]